VNHIIAGSGIFKNNGKKYNAKNITPITKLAAGPAPEIIVSERGVLGSSSILETPPNIYSSISETFNPCLKETIECDNSWAIIDASIMSPFITPAIMILAISNIPVS